jgi:nitroreductase
MIARVIKARLQSSGLTGQAYVLARDAYHRARKLGLYGRDARQTWRDMRWRGAASQSYWVLSAELFFQYHKLEKGLSMPGPKRFFGYDPASATMNLLERWRAQGLPTQSRVYRGAVATLQAYRERLDITPPARGALLLQRLDSVLAAHGVADADVLTPQPLQALQQAAGLNVGQLGTLLHARRSVRAFNPERQVPRELLTKAVELAQLSPSACNRQPWRVHAYEGRERIDALLRHQDGNRGFGHTAPLLLIICSDARCFFDASERHEPYVDGGLFAMSLTLALQAQGLSSCCLNWCVENAQDHAAHILGGLDPAERIVMFMVVGYAADEAVVPRSPRRPLEDVLTFHTSKN